MLLAFMLTIGAVSATTSWDDVLKDLDSMEDFNVEYFDCDTNVSVGDYFFTIPEGFGQIDSMAINMTEGNSSGIVKFFKNADDEILMVSLTSGDDLNASIQNYIPENVSYENFTIEGHDGVKWTDMPFSFFSYIDGNTVVVLQAPKDSYFEEMII